MGQGPVVFIGRAPRGRFGRAMKWIFWGFQLLMILALLGNCAVVLPYIGSDDPEVAMGAGMFGGMLGLALTALWPLGTALLGLALLLTRGKKVVIRETPPAS
jgi:uncharacterized membrane protein YhaH (DUF805 family)